MQNNQTPVEFLIKEFSDILGPINTDAMQNLLLTDAMKRAKEMEKSMVISAYALGVSDASLKKYKTGGQYYEETYGK